MKNVKDIRTRMLHTCIMEYISNKTYIKMDTGKNNLLVCLFYESLPLFFECQFIEDLKPFITRGVCHVDFTQDAEVSMSSYDNMNDEGYRSAIQDSLGIQV